MNAVYRTLVTRRPRRFLRAAAIHALLAAALLTLSSGSSLAFEKELAALSVRLTNKIAISGKKKVAVVDFVDIGANVTELGRFLAEELSTQLVNGDRGLAVVDRANLRYLLEEHKLSMRGLLNPNNAKKLGRIAGVDAIILGTITPIGERVRVIVKAIDVETATILASSTTYLAMTQTIKNLLEREIQATGRSAGRQSGPANRRARAGGGAQGMASFRHTMFNLHLVNLRQTADGSVIYADFTLKNTTREALRIAIKSRYPSQTSNARVSARILTSAAQKCGARNYNVSGFGFATRRSIRTIKQYGDLEKGGTRRFSLEFSCPRGRKLQSADIYISFLVYSKNQDSTEEITANLNVRKIR